MVLFLCFFFSSRRRHTRCSRDWSSDVCSSDLVTAQHGKILKNLGVSEVIFPERDAAIRLARRLVSPNVLEYLELAPGFSVEELTVPDHMSGLRMCEAKIQETYNVNLIGIRKKVTRMVKGRMTTDEVFNVTPSLDDVIEKGDI